MSTMDRSEYPNLLARLQPAQAVDVLNERMKQIAKLNTSVADWLQERRQLEEQYANGLRRLARNQLDGAELGVFSVPWTTMTASVEALADSHTAYAAKLDSEIERPLREFAPKNREYVALVRDQGNLSALAKDVDRAQQKALKLEGRNANRLADASSDLDQAQVDFQTQAPYLFSQLQGVDENRLGLLRDLLTQSQTIEMDQVEKHRVATEHCLNILLNVETQDEIATFAIRASSGVVRSSTSRSNRASISGPLSIGRSNQGASSSDLAPIQSLPDEDVSQQGGAGEKEKSGKNPLKGLKRLGTVMGRRSSKMPAGALPPTTEEKEPERKQRSSRFGLGRNKSSYSSDQIPDEDPSGRPPLPQIGSEVFNRNASAATQPDPVAQPSRSDFTPQMNGSSTFTIPESSGLTNGAHDRDLADLSFGGASSATESTAPAANNVQKDNEGYSLPPLALDPISQAEAALSGEPAQPQFNVNILKAPIQEEGGTAALENVATKLQAPPTSQRRMGTVRGRRDARNSAMVIPGSSEESPNEPAFTSAFLSSDASPTAGPSATQSYAAAPAPAPPATFAAPSQATTASAISPVHTPTIASSASLGAAFGAAAGSASAFAPTTSPDPISAIRPSSKAAIGTDFTGDAQSIRSNLSLASTGSQGMKHPELTEAGLNSSVIETVSAKFENGQLTSSSLIGEIALAHNAVDFSSPFGLETIRLENFSLLDRVAPNPAFLTQTPGREGEYSVKLASISKPQIAFKYQLRHDDAAAQVPLLVSTAFKIEPTQSSVIVSCALHPQFALRGRTSITLANTTLALTLEGAKPTGCMSKPVGTFARERALIYWQLDSVTLTPGAAPQKLLARFATDGQATGGSVEAKWELVGENARGLGSGLAVSTPAASTSAGDADPFADEEGAAGGGWKKTPTVLKINSGSYAAK